MNQRYRSKDLLMALAIAILLLVAGAAGGWWWAQRSAMPMPATADQAAPAEQQVLYWYDPMMPQQQFDKPGPSPFMDMELVPMYADSDSGAAGVKIDPSVTQNLGVRLATVRPIPLATQIEASGVIGFNERDVALVQSRAGGFVERVWPLAPGDLVKAGQPLVELLVPEWTAAQYELFAVKATGDATLVAAARERLRLLGMSETLIAAVEKSGTVRSNFTISAPIAGVIESLEMRRGMTVMAGQSVARINGLATVWLEVAVPEMYAATVRVGGNAEVRLAGFAGQTLTGRITTILPTLSEATRSLRVRVELPNHDGRLRPGLSGQVVLKGTSDESALAVPTEAVIRTGKRTLVMVALKEGRFEPVAVTLGREVGDQIVIKTGLSEGEQVVASGQFLIDSEASLKGFKMRSPAELPQSPVVTLHESTATITELVPGEVMLDHGPFKTLAMPGMEMSFPLAQPALTQGFKLGDRVTVFVRQSDEGLIVERLEKVGGGL